ncbi:hypothetical protein P0D71_18070 [Paraburkholderia sp. RL17-383-BIF-A]|uniref:hypothetical protein n=1 Tax=Paraburkholderia TaxID=1822464 RepID=UPI0038BB6479
MSNRTLRSIPHAWALASLIASRTALLLIDFQNEYFTGSPPIAGKSSFTPTCQTPLGR